MFKQETFVKIEIVNSFLNGTLGEYRTEEDIISIKILYLIKTQNVEIELRK